MFFSLGVSATHPTLLFVCLGIHPRAEPYTSSDNCDRCACQLVLALAAKLSDVRPGGREVYVMLHVAANVLLGRMHKLVVFGGQCNMQPPISKSSVSSKVYPSGAWEIQGPRVAQFKS